MYSSGFSCGVVNASSVWQNVGMTVTSSYPSDNRHAVRTYVCNIYTMRKSGFSDFLVILHIRQCAQTYLPPPPPPPQGKKEVCVGGGGGVCKGKGGAKWHSYLMSELENLKNCTPAVGTNRDLLLIHTQHLQEEVWDKWKLAFWFPNIVFFPTGDQKYVTNMTIFWIWRLKIHDGRNHSLNVIIKNTLQMLKSSHQKYTTDTTILWMWSSKIHDGHNHSTNVDLINARQTQPFSESGA